MLAELEAGESKEPKHLRPVSPRGGTQEGADVLVHDTLAELSGGKGRGRGFSPPGGLRGGRGRGGRGGGRGNTYRSFDEVYAYILNRESRQVNPSTNLQREYAHSEPRGYRTSKI